MDSDENALLELSEKHKEIIDTYVDTLNTVLEWLESFEENDKFNNYIIASSYLLTVSHFQDSFIQLIHETMEHCSKLEWDNKPKFIRDIFSKIVKGYHYKFDVVNFVSRYQETFHIFFKNTASVELISNDEKLIAYCRKFYRLDTNRYEDLHSKFNTITGTSLDNNIRINSYEYILIKRNKYAHNKIPSDLSSIGAKREIRSFLQESESWLGEISKELIKKCERNS